MYPFEHLSEAQERLWSAVRSRLDDAPDALDHDVELHAAWRRPDLLMAQTCGWPLVRDLGDVVEVIGAFDVVAPFATGGRYRSVIVASKPPGIDEWKADPATVVAQNSPDSLSGWISLQSVWGGVPAKVLRTGSHVESVRAVARGDAQLASIDALSFEFVAEIEPATAGRVHIVGHGPLVPSLPLVMAKGLAERRDDLRAAIHAAVTDPFMAAACAQLRIRGFVPFGFEEYAPLRELLRAH
jgi:ABC-type phosphate/phosphonate transport system substrate-binding protein